MSRSIKGSKGAGFDYSSRRAGNAGGCNCPGPITKLLTHRKERRANKKAANDK